MATFPSVTPTYQGFSKKSAPAVRTVRFADGFEQRIFFGLPSNQIMKRYNLNFELSETEADIVDAFLTSRARDQASFTFTPPGEGLSKTGTKSCSAALRKLGYNVADIIFFKVYQLYNMIVYNSIISY